MMTQVSYDELLNMFKKMDDLLEKYDMGRWPDDEQQQLNDDIDAIRKQAVYDWFPTAGAMLLTSGVETTTVAIERGVVLCNNKVINLKKCPYETSCFEQWQMALAS